MLSDISHRGRRVGAAHQKRSSIMCGLQSGVRARHAFLAMLGVALVTGCGEDTLSAPAPQRQPPRAASPTIETSVPPGAEVDALVSPDSLATPSGGDGDAPSAFSSDGGTAGRAGATEDTELDSPAGAEDTLASPSGPKMPTEHSHWLSLAQFGEHVTIRLDGVWYGDFSGPALRDITMALRPGPNTLTVTSLPQNADAWLAVHVTEGEHTPPIPDLVAYRVFPRRDSSTGDKTALPAQETRTFRFTAQ